MVEDRSVLALAHEGLRDADAVDTLRDVGGEVGLLVALDLPRAPLAPLHEHDDRKEHRQSAQADQCEPDMQQEHKDQDKN